MNTPKYEYIRTYTGIAFPVFDAQPEHVEVDDIVHALPLVVRFGGHCSRFYSVAEHTLLVADLASDNGYNQDVVDACILHDISECYLADVPAPFKRHLPQYNDCEDKIQKVIYERFRCPQEKDAVKLFDVVALFLEGNALMAEPDIDWDLSKIPGNIDTSQSFISNEEIPIEVLEGDLRCRLEDIVERRCKNAKSETGSLLCR